MKKIKNIKSDNSHKNHIKVDEAVDEIDQALLLTKKSQSKVQASRPQTVDVTHRFGKRSGST